MINQAFVESLVRAGMQVLAGYLIGRGVIDASAAEGLVGGGVSIAAVIWSWLTHVGSNQTLPPAQG